LSLHGLRLGQRRANAVRDYLAGIVPGAKGPGHAGIENRWVTLVIDHAAVATDHVAMP
jgi:hypothetical protein